MEQFRNLLSWNTSAKDPLVLAILLGAIAAMTLLLFSRPRLYLPLILLTTPLPKLFTITQYEEWGHRQNAAGFSVGDLVLAAGLAALLLRGARKSLPREASAFGHALMLWSGSVCFSVAMGLVLWRGTYQLGNSLYAFRYILTLASCAVAARYAMSARNERSVRSLLVQLAVAGNVTVALGVLYYFSVGSSAGGSVSNMLYSADTAVFRGYLFFFDYGIDMGYYAVTIAILNIILLSQGRTAGSRLISGIGIGLCIAAVLLVGERVNVLVLLAALGYFFLETAKARHRSVRVSVVFQITCLLVVIGAGVAIMGVVAPGQMIRKFDRATQSEFQEAAGYAMSQAGVPPAITAFVSALPIGDFAVRLGLNIASLWFFFQHPLGVGFWGEWSVVGWYAHHEIVKIAVEQSIPGLVAFVWLMVMLRRLLWVRGDLPGSGGQLGVLLRSISVGLFAALLGANTVLLDMKFAMVYWTLVGVWSVLPRTRTRRLAPVAIREIEAVNV